MATYCSDVQLQQSNSKLQQQGLQGCQPLGHLQEFELLRHAANLQQPDIPTALQEQQQMQMTLLLGGMQEQHLQDNDLSVLRPAQSADDKNKNKHGFRGVRKRPW
jgi:hypothetical protein